MQSSSTVVPFRRQYAKRGVPLSAQERKESNLFVAKVFLAIAREYGDSCEEVFGFFLSEEEVPSRRSFNEARRRMVQEFGYADMAISRLDVWHVLYVTRGNFRPFQK